MDNNNLVNDLSGILDGLDSSQEQLERMRLMLSIHLIHRLIL